ncbi:MAG: hypothetical protein ACXABZ_14790 [Candidatus Thorarchaeota archaeon]
MNMIGIVGVFPFAGTGFLESKDQLWVIQSAPSGAMRFMRGRLASGFIMAIPLSAIPSVVIGYMFNIGMLSIIQLFVVSFLTVCGAVMVAMGITALNPNYEDTKSPAHQTALVGSMMLTQFTLIAPFFLDIFLSIGLGIDLFGVLRGMFGSLGMALYFSLAGPCFLILVGSLMMALGIRSLGKPDA